MRNFLHRLAIRSGFREKFLERFRDREQAMLLLLAVLVGIVMGLVAAAFRLAISESHHFFQEMAHHDDLQYYKAAIPAMGGLIVGLVIYKFLSLRGGHGVPAVMKAVATGNLNLPPSMAVKSSSSVVTITSGGSCGPEGPIVEIGSVIGSLAGRRGKLSRESVGTLIGCGAASGIAAFFNAPFGGVFLAIELLLRDFAVRTFGPIMISAVIAHVTSEAILPHAPLFHAGNTEAAVSETLLATIQPGFPQILMFGGLGLLCGVMGSLLVYALYIAHDFFQAIRIPLWMKPAIGGLGVGIVGLSFPDVIGEGYEFVNEQILKDYLAPAAEDLSLPTLFFFLAVAFLKILVTSLTLGSGGTGGTFAPAMIVGAMTGAGVGVLCNSYFPGFAPSVPIFALVGMAGCVCAALGVPIAGILIIYEVSGGDYRLVLPLMICVATSALAALSLGQGSVYTLSLLRDGFDVEEAIRRGKDPLASIPVSQIMNSNFVRLAPEDNLAKVLDAFSFSDDDAFPVVTPEGELTGIVFAGDLRGVLNMGDLGEAIIASDAADPNPRVLTPEMTAEDALAIFTASDVAGIPVVESKGSRKVIGIVGRVEVLGAYSQAAGKRESGIYPSADES